KLRKDPSKTRQASYSAPLRALGPSDRVRGSVDCDFVGYTEGKSLYVPSRGAVISKDFTGCLMVLYSQNGERRVAHSAASQDPDMDCKRAFLRTLTANGA